MRRIDGDLGKYYLPAKFRSSMPVSMHILHLTMSVFFIIALIFIPDYKNPTAKDILMIISAGFLVIFLLVNWLYVGALRLGKLEIDNHGIYLHTLTLKKNIRWKNVKYIGITDGPRVKGASEKVLQIILFESDGTESAWERLNAKLAGNYLTYSVPLSSFSDIPWDVFMRTVSGIIDSISVPVEEKEEAYPEDEI